MQQQQHSPHHISANLNQPSSVDNKAFLSILINPFYQHTRTLSAFSKFYYQNLFTYIQFILLIPQTIY